MILDWFNAREAVAVGTSLADSLVLEVPGGGRARANHGEPEVRKLLQRAARDTPALKLNLFTRAKLLETFKSRLRERGLEGGRAEELAHRLLMQLSGGDRLGGPAPAGATAPPVSGGNARKRIPALLGEGEALIREGKHAAAVERLEQVLAIDPEHAPALTRLAEALCQQGHYAAAERVLRKTIQIDPRRAEAQLRLGSLLQWRGDFFGSETALRRATRLEPRSANALSALGHTMSSLDRAGEARSCFDKALRLDPRCASALCGLGWLAGAQGRFAQAETLLHKALESDPEYLEAHVLTVDQRRMTGADGQWLETARRLLARQLSPMDEAKIRFAMGKYFNDLRDYRRAFGEYRRANELRRRVSAPYDRSERAAWVDEVIGVYAADRVTQVMDGASDSDKPVLVVGMPRSGTSLVEQIVASHPQAVGAGELQFWGMTAYKQPHLLRQRPPDAQFTGKLADAYLKELTRGRAEAARIVDKTPANADYLGLIHRVFPKARIIYVRRDPVDSCLSCYFQNFTNAAGFTMDLGDLAHYYREHHRLIRHWRSVLPREVLLEVPYAQLVADQEGWSRKIIEFLGLAWDAKVLEFHKTDRAVLTASYWQVRQQIYSSSIGRWKHYRKFIGPLLELRKLEHA